jgi:hypothetical protein
MGKSFELFTETSANQITVLAIVLIAVLEIINMATARMDTYLFEYVVGVIAGLAGYQAGKAREKKRRVKKKE